VLDHIQDVAPEYENPVIDFHLTSVHDHSLHEAYSRVLHKLIEDMLPFLEQLVNMFCGVSVALS
jgi:Ras-related GTP-binding protein C/D